MNWVHYVLLTVLGVAGGVLGGLVSSELFHEKKVKTRALYVMDGQRRVRVVLGMDSGQPRMLFFDQEGRHRGMVGIFSNGRPGLMVFDSFGRASLQVGESPKGTPALTFFDGNGKVRATLFLSQYGWPKIKLLDERGEALFQIPMPAPSPPPADAGN